MKWNSIVVKLGTTIILLLLMVLLPLGYIVNQIFSTFYFNEVKLQLDQLSSQYARSIHSLEDEERLTMLELLGKMTEQSIIIVSQEGRVIANSGSPIFKKGSQIDLDMLLKLRDKREVQTLKIDEKSANRYYLVGKGLYKDERFIGGLFVMTSVEGVYQSLDKIRNLMILAGIGSIFLAMGFTYIVSRKMTNPLLEIEKATKEIAKGTFSTRTSIRSQDEIGHLAQAINDMAIELENVQVTRNEFFANISHELRTPLTYVEGYTRVIKENRYKSESERNDYLNVIQQEVERMTKLVEDLFELSKMQEGKIKLNLEEIDLIELVEGILLKVRISTNQKGLILNFDKTSDHPVSIIADPVRMEQVLLNLLENSIRYTDKGSISIIVGITGAYVTLSIRDSGIGIPENELPYLFDRFYRVEKSRSRKFGGTGLGLSIVKHLVELQHGKISVKSVLGKGTEFQLTFPYYKEEEQQ